MPTTMCGSISPSAQTVLVVLVVRHVRRALFVLLHGSEDSGAVPIPGHLRPSCHCSAAAFVT